MNRNRLQSPGLIVEAVRPQPALGNLGLFEKQGQIKVPNRAADTDLYFYETRHGGAPTFDQLPPANQGSEIQGSKWGLFYRVDTAPQELELQFPNVFEDNDGSSWDLILALHCRVTNSKTFLAELAFEWVTPDAPLSKQMFASWLANKIRSDVKDAVAGISVESGTKIRYLRDQEGLNKNWWDGRLNKQWLEGRGITFAVTQARWESKDEARAQVEQENQKELKRRVEERERLLQVQLRELELIKEFDARKLKIEVQNANQKKQLEYDATLSNEARKQQLARLELEYRQQLLEAESELEKAKRAKELAHLDDEIAKEKRLEELDRLRQARAQRQKEQIQHAEHLHELQRIHAHLAEDGERLAPLLLLLNDPDPVKAAQAAAWLTRLGVSAQELSMLGYTVTREVLAEMLVRKERADRGAVSLRKMNLQTRSLLAELSDISLADEVEIAARAAVTRDLGSGRIESLRIGSSLQFEFTTRNRGYVTLLNIGTSGSVFLHVPNVFVAREKASAAANAKYQVPGREFLPGEKIGAYHEDGPRGFERIAIIVSETPVVPEMWIQRSNASDPIVKLSEAEVATLYASFCNLDSSSWSAGLLSFHVA